MEIEISMAGYWKRFSTGRPSSAARGQGTLGNRARRGVSVLRTWQRAPMAQAAGASPASAALC